MRVGRHFQRRFERQFGKGARLVIERRPLGLQGEHQVAVVQGGNAKALDTVVPYGVIDPIFGARRRMQN